MEHASSVPNTQEGTIKIIRSVPATNVASCTSFWSVGLVKNALSIKEDGTKEKNADLIHAILGNRSWKKEHV